MRLRIGKIAGYLKYKTLHWCTQYKASECGFHDSYLDHVLAWWQWTDHYHIGGQSYDMSEWY